MTILILGATGRTGKWLLETALQRGYDVHILVRNKNKIQQDHAHLKVFEGLPTNEADLRKAITGCEAVVSALNISRHSDFPWSKLRTPVTFLSDTMKVLLKLCREQHISRIIVTSAWGVADTRKDIPGWFKWLIDHSNIGAAYADHERQEKLLMQSQTDWTSVRAVGLTNTKKVSPVRVASPHNPRPSLTVGRLNVAMFMIDQIASKEYLKAAITVSA